MNIISMREQTHRGEWWIPDSDSNPVAGIMTYKPPEGIVLELYDSIGSSPDPFSPRDLDKIFGNVFEEGPVTLVNATSTGGRFSSGSKIQQTFTTPTAFVGAHFEEEVDFSELKLVFPDLQAFTSHNVIATELRSEEGPTMSTEIIGGESTEAEIEGLEVALRTSPTVSSKLSSIEYSRNSTLSIESGERLPYQKWRQYLNFIQRYVSLAFKNPIHPSKVVANDDIEVLYHIAQYHEPPEIRGPFELAFTQSDIIFEESLGRWFAHSREAETLHDMYFSIVYDPDMYIQYNFLALSIAIESYFKYLYPDRLPMEKEDYNEFRENLMTQIPDKIPVKERIRNLLESIGNDYSFRNKIREVIQEYESILGELLDIEDVVRRITATRHGIVHSLNMENDSWAASELEDLVRLTEELRLIIEAILYGIVGVEDEQIVKILSDRHKRVIK